MIDSLMKEKRLSKYMLSKKSGVPYSTLSDILSGKTKLEKCSGETIYRLARELEVSMEELLAPCVESRPDFAIFKSNVCHQLKELGDIDFIIETLERDDIYKYYRRKWYPECFYLLAMLDYISRMNSVPVCKEYNALREMKLEKIIYPTGIVAATLASGDEEIKRRACERAIPEFMRFNIVESEVRDVV